MPARLRPTAPIAPAAILVGDPGRALLLAQGLLEQPKMSNHARGLWGYTGRAAAGEELTIQSTGMGGPSAAIVLGDLAELGVKRAVRVGTCAASNASLEAGELVVVEAACLLDGNPIPPEPALTEALARELGPRAATGTVASLDVIYRPGKDAPAPGEVVDMQTAALLMGATELGVAAAAVLVVTETPAEQIGDVELEAVVKRAGAAAANVLSPSS
jgi:purine-nucleoside phosphorylase